MRAMFLLPLLAAPALAAPPEVAVIKPVEREVFDHANVTGRTDASTTVEIRSRLVGAIMKVHFRDGAAVKKGEILAEMDDRLQKAEVEKAQAEMKRAEARLKVAELDYSRLVKLGEAKSVSQDEVAKAQATLEEAKAVMMVARAAVGVARINLEYTRIVAPIDGRIGRAKVAAGELVQSAELLATLYASDPLHVYFDLDEPTVLRLIRYQRERGDEKTMVAVALTGDEGFPRQATVDFLDPSVDAKTGHLRVRAVLPNPKEEVRPGQFVRIRVQLGQPRKALVLPDVALGESRSGGHPVLIVNDKNRLEERVIEVGMVHDRMVEVVKGLTAADRVVRDRRGLKAGDEVNPKSGKGPLANPGGTGVANPQSRPLPDLPGSGPALIVSANYPGASANTVADTVGTPIDQQLNGLEKLTHRVQACGDDGTMRFTLLFEKGTDLNKAQVLAQNRVSVALPQLPEEVRRLGITVRKRGMAHAAVAVRSPTDQYDRTFLANYAKARLRDEFARVPGVADVSFYADAEPSPRVRLQIDRDKMTALGLTVGDLTKVLEQQNMKAEAVTGGHLALTVSGRLPDPDQLGRLEITNDQGRRFPLGTVARVELGEAWGAVTNVDGKPCVLLLVSRLTDAHSKATSRAVRESVAGMAKHAPEGIELKVIDLDP